MNTFIKTGKDKIKNEDHSNVEYKIISRLRLFVRQTKRKLKKRLKEHINDFKQPTNTLSLVTN